MPPQISGPYIKRCAEAVAIKKIRTFNIIGIFLGGGGGGGGGGISL